MMLEDLHKLAFEGLYLLPGSIERGEKRLDPEPLLAQLTTEQRDRVLRMATRRLAFQMLYELDLSGKPDAKVAINQTLAEIDGLGPMALEDVRALVLGALEGGAAADAEFAALAPEWPTHRQPAVDRAILRLAHYEMTSARTPPKIVINEAVELAKHYSTEKAPAFINGLLDKVLKRLEGEEKPF
jgi:N utilization substance protein B